MLFRSRDTLNSSVNIDNKKRYETGAKRGIDVEGLLVKCATKVEGTDNALEVRETINHSEFIIARDLEAAVNLLQLRQ